MTLLSRYRSEGEGKRLKVETAAGPLHLGNHIAGDRVVGDASVELLDN
jgi:hypothetical protein